MDRQFLLMNSIKIIKEDVGRNFPLVVLDKLRVGRFLWHKNPLFFNITVHVLIMKGSIMYSAGEVFIFCSDVRCCINKTLTVEVNIAKFVF